MDSGIINPEGGGDVNDKEREQWDDFLGKYEYYKGISPYKNAVVIHPIALKGNEYVYERLLRCPHFMMNMFEHDEKVFFDGVYHTEKVCIARIVRKDTCEIKNYEDKDKFIEDFCKIAIAGIESEFEPVICQYDVIGNFVDIIDQIMQ